MGRAGQALFRRARIGDLQLFGRQRHAGDGGVCDLGDIEPEPAPARADVEHALAGLDEQLGGDVPFLGELRVVERGVLRLEIGAAILLVAIQEERIEPGVEIVVMRDVVTGARARIELLQVPRQVAQMPPGSCPLRQEVGLIEQDREGISYGAALDDEVAVHIGLAESELGIDEDLPLRLRSDEAHRDRLAGTVADSEPGSAGAGHRHRPAADELREKSPQQSVHRHLPLERTRRDATNPAFTSDAQVRLWILCVCIQIWGRWPGPAIALCSERIFQNRLITSLRAEAASIRSSIR